ncbi:MAG: metallophosphoesterase [Candidatus Hydrogenedentes bacterium]|nr:metallophosphoesterase [Candidatus Hydrogenedentota bacterium]
MSIDRFLHITDLHFWEIVRNPFAMLNKRALGNINVLLRRRHEFHMDRADAFADMAISTGITTLLLGGDFTSTATEHEFELARRWTHRIADRGLQIHVLPGNHDVYTFESVRSKRFVAYFREFIPKGGYPARVELPGGTPLILVPTVVPNFLSSKGRITKKQIKATARLLEACPKRPIVVAGHYPVLHKTGAYSSSASRRLRRAEALGEVLGQAQRPILYLAGHVHRFSHTIDPEYPQVQHVTSAAFFLKRPRESQQGGFSEIHIHETGFQVFRHWCDEKWDVSLEVPLPLDYDL